MDATPPDGQRPAGTAPALAALAPLAGALAAAALWLVADWLSRASPSAGPGDTGAPLGNAALAVPFIGLPAILAGGWAGLGLAHIGRRRGRLLGGVWLATTDAALLAAVVVFGPLLGLGSPYLPALLAAPAVGFGLILLWFARAPRARTPGARRPSAGTVEPPTVPQGRPIAAGVVAALLAGGALLGLPGLAYLLAPILIAVVMVVPLLIGAATTPDLPPPSRTRLLAGAVLLPLGVLGGVAGAVALLRWI